MIAPGDTFVNAWPLFLVVAAVLENTFPLFVVTNKEFGCGESVEDMVCGAAMCEAARRIDGQFGELDETADGNCGGGAFVPIGRIGSAQSLGGI